MKCYSLQMLWYYVERQDRSVKNFSQFQTHLYLSNIIMIVWLIDTIIAFLENQGKPRVTHHVLSFHHPLPTFWLEGNQCFIRRRIISMLTISQVFSSCSSCFQYLPSLGGAWSHYNLPSCHPRLHQQSPYRRWGEKLFVGLLLQRTQTSLHPTHQIFSNSLHSSGSKITPSRLDFAVHMITPELCLIMMPWILGYFLPVCTILSISKQEVGNFYNSLAIPPRMQHAIPFPISRVTIPQFCATFFSWAWENLFYQLYSLCD